MCEQCIAPGHVLSHGLRRSPCRLSRLAAGSSSLCAHWKDNYMDRLFSHQGAMSYLPKKYLFPSDARVINVLNAQRQTQLAPFAGWATEGHSSGNVWTRCAGQRAMPLSGSARRSPFTGVEDGPSARPPRDQSSTSGPVGFHGRAGVACPDSQLWTASTAGNQSVATVCH